MRSLLLALAFFLFQGPQTEAPGSLEGVVVQLGTSTPVAGARVALFTTATLTDENGRFVFQNVQPGRYRLSVSHNDYIPAQFGQRVTGATGRELTVVSGQTIKDIVVALTPKGMI